MLVTPEMMRNCANQLETLRESATATITSYLNTANEVNVAGAWNGAASTNNVAASTDIHQAQAELHNRWQMVIDALRRAADIYQSQEETSAASTASVSL